MIKAGDMDLFKRILPIKGYLMKKWHPVIARRVDRLYTSGLVKWHSEGERRSDFGMRICLTKKGQIVRRKLKIG